MPPLLRVEQMLLVLSVYQRRVLPRTICRHIACPALPSEATQRARLITSGQRVGADGRNSTVSEGMHRKRNGRVFMRMPLSDTPEIVVFVDTQVGAQMVAAVTLVPEGSVELEATASHLWVCFRP